jgi:hypothetical protein
VLADPPWRLGARGALQQLGRPPRRRGPVRVPRGEGRGARSTQTLLSGRGGHLPATCSGCRRFGHRRRLRAPGGDSVGSGVAMLWCCGGCGYVWPVSAARIEVKTLPGFSWAGGGGAACVICLLGDVTEASSSGAG